MLARYPQLTCQAKACVAQANMQIKKARELLFTLCMLIRDEGASNRLIGTSYGKLLCRIYLLYSMYLLKLTDSLLHWQVTRTLVQFARGTNLNDGEEDCEHEYAAPNALPAHLQTIERLEVGQQIFSGSKK